MGCAPSGASCKNTGVRLIATKLTFTKDQLENLNGYFRRIAEGVGCEGDSMRLTSSTEATVERLIQRLIASVASLDKRFSSMFLISLNERRRIKQSRFEYLLRIDALSSPVLDADAEAAVNVEEDVSIAGFVRLRIRATSAESWAEFLGAGGRLRRDVVKARLAKLLATAIKQEAVNLDEDGICSSPGQVVDAEVLEKILKQPEHCRIFYGSASTDGPPPEPNDHRVALVEDSSGILLKIGLQGKSSRDIQVRLLVGVGVSSWSSQADYPRRVPLHHCDALLHYTAAQSGMYAVAVGPHHGARCEDRATLWRIRAPAAETIMNQHYGDESVVALTDAALLEILDQLRQRRVLDLPMKQRDALRVVSRHIIRTIHRWSLERSGPDPLRSWAPDTLSRHVLLILDELVTALKCQNLRCYFHPRCNVMLQCAKGGVLHHDDSYMSDARLVESYLTTLYQHSSSMKPADPCPMDVMESELIARWRRVMASLPRGTMTGDYGYSVRQLEYLSLVIKEALRAKVATLQGHFDSYAYLTVPLSSQTTEPIENLVYLLRLVLKQARDQIYIVTDRRSRKRGRGKIMRKRRRRNTGTYFERSVDLLIDMVRRDRETAYLDLESHAVMAKTFLRWMYFAMDHDRKILEPILRPYLGNLFNATHENAWHVDSWRKRLEARSTEMRSLGMFCKLVTMRETSPANGIVESLSKGWCWAESVARMIEQSGNSLKLILLTPRRTARYNLTFANNKGLSAFSTWSKARNIGNAVRRNRNISRFGTIDDSLYGFKDEVDEKVSKGVAGHTALRDLSPLTYVVSMGRRRGRQRGPGDLISALISLNKFRILQEVAAVLPHHERIAMLDMVQRASRESSRRLRRASCPDSSATGSPKQTYKPRSESNLLDSPPTKASGSTSRCSRSPAFRHLSGIVAERQRQLHREMQEMHDTLARGLRPRQRLPAWDSLSMASWTSSIGSVGRNRLRRCRLPIWDSFAGSSPLWASVSTDDSFAKSRSEEMISREESPKWNTLGNRRTHVDDFYGKEEDRLPSWDVLEATLNKKLSRYDRPRWHDCSLEPDSLEIHKDVSIDYLLTANDRKAFPRRPVETLNSEHKMIKRQEREFQRQS